MAQARVQIGGQGWPAARRVALRLLELIEPGFLTAMHRRAPYSLGPLQRTDERPRPAVPQRRPSGLSRLVPDLETGAAKRILLAGLVALLVARRRAETWIRGTALSFANAAASRPRPVRDVAPLPQRPRVRIESSPGLAAHAFARAAAGVDAASIRVRSATADIGEALRSRPRIAPEPARPRERPRLGRTTLLPAAATRGRRDAIAAAAVALVAALAAVGLSYLVAPREAGPVATASLPQEKAGAAGPLRSAVLDGEPLRLRREVSLPEPYQIAWPFDLVDGLTFGPEGAVRTQLVGLEGPSRDSICNDGEGRPWACGLRARAALNNVVKGQSFVCQAGGPPVNNVLKARCSGEVDVARELVLAGFARPTVRDPVLEVAADEARQNMRGLWDGNWTIRNPAR